MTSKTTCASSVAASRLRSFRPNATDRSSQAGQTTIALAAVLAIGCFAAVFIATIGGAVVHRARAHTAADAVALAGVVDPGAADRLGRWYETHGVDLDAEAGHVIARSGPSRAAAWAALGTNPNQPAPALKAIIARMEQVLDATITPASWLATAVVVTSADAIGLRGVAAEFGLCESLEPGETDGTVVFELC